MALFCLTNVLVRVYVPRISPRFLIVSMLTNVYPGALFMGVGRFGEMLGVLRTLSERIHEIFLIMLAVRLVCYDSPTIIVANDKTIPLPTFPGTMTIK